MRRKTHIPGDDTGLDKNETPEYVSHTLAAYTIPNLFYIPEKEKSRTNVKKGGRREKTSVPKPDTQPLTKPPPAW